jgi:hypothetical protein
MMGFEFERFLSSSSLRPSFESSHPRIKERIMNKISPMGMAIIALSKINSPHDFSLNDCRKTTPIRKNWI